MFASVLNSGLDQLPQEEDFREEGPKVWYFRRCEGVHSMEYHKPKPQPSKAMFVVSFSFLCSGTFRVLCSNNPGIGCSEWQKHLRPCLKLTVCATTFIVCLLDCLRI